MSALPAIGELHTSARRAGTRHFQPLGSWRQLNVAEIISDRELGGVMTSSDIKLATVTRTNSLLRDIIFPFYSFDQFLVLAVLCAAVYVIDLFVGHDPVVVAVAWVAGSAQLTTVAPARLTFPASWLPALYAILDRMHFRKEPDGFRFRYRRWIAWQNSSLELHHQNGMVEVDGPMSTLVFVARQLNKAEC